jgi:hypothetical protein
MSGNGAYRNWLWRNSLGSGLGTDTDDSFSNNYYGRAQSSNIPLLTPPETPESSQEMGDTVLNAAEHRPIAAKPSEGGSDAG